MKTTKKILSTIQEYQDAFDEFKSIREDFVNENLINYENEFIFITFEKDLYVFYSRENESPYVVTERDEASFQVYVEDMFAVLTEDIEDGEYYFYDSDIKAFSMIYSIIDKEVSFKERKKIQLSILSSIFNTIKNAGLPGITLTKDVNSNLDYSIVLNSKKIASMTIVNNKQGFYIEGTLVYRMSENRQQSTENEDSFLDKISLTEEEFETALFANISALD